MRAATMTWRLVLPAAALAAALTFPPSLDAQQATEDARVDQLAVTLSVFFQTYSDPQYDRWNGGKSKAGDLADLDLA